MDKPVLMIEMPELNTESVILVHNFLESLLHSFEAHYFNQIRDHYRSSIMDDEIDF